jgi:uncharacterized protein YfaS (alpha-2-macroglobulin family)
MLMSPFSTYVGLRTELDKDEWGDTFLRAGKPHRFDVATVGADGKGVSAGGLHAEVYHVDWSWWWNSSAEIASYMAGKSKERVFDERISTTDGRGSFSYDWAKVPAGTYYIRVKASADGAYTAPSEVVSIVVEERSALGRTDAETTVRKVVENGQVVIIRDGVRYSVIGTCILH